jgi:hypothetical protein
MSRKKQRKFLLLANLITRVSLVLRRLEHLMMKDLVNKGMKLGGNSVSVKEKTNHGRK